MSITFDKALGVHPQAVALRLSRAELLSANLANVDTPNFQAKDIDFAAEMQRSSWSFSNPSAPQEMYRVPYQPSSDGNTVALNVEQAGVCEEYPGLSDEPGIFKHEIHGPEKGH
ncbi:flagellar rod protein [Citrobacter koseri]|uniref:Flagellar rod protein n=1 Tax=Citrobacter koseri TaxID=545 RepID=A0A2X2V8A4_CITKO|nr:flagellar rod protein [Citrobacter koseri]